MTVTQTGAAIVELAGEFARREIAPRVAQYDRDEMIPRELLDQMAELGFSAWRKIWANQTSCTAS